MYEWKKRYNKWKDSETFEECRDRDDIDQKIVDKLELMLNEFEDNNPPKSKEEDSKEIHQQTKVAIANQSNNRCVCNKCGQPHDPKLVEGSTAKANHS